MKIFIGSSRESLDLTREIQGWLEAQEHEPIPWDKPGLFPPGEQTFKILMEISRDVEAAILVFGTDDKVWYRGDTVSQPRDNVLIEYGLFGGVLGPQKAIICRDGNPRYPIDLAGLTHIDLSLPRRPRGKIELSIWLRKVASGAIDPALLASQAKIHELERDRERLADRLRFEADKTRDLSVLLQNAGIVDFSHYDLTADGHWKLLFDHDYFTGATNLLTRASETPTQLRQLLLDTGFQSIADEIAWHSPGDPGRKAPEMSSQRTGFLAKKALRRFRASGDAGKYQKFVYSSPSTLRAFLDEEAKEAIARRPSLSNSRET